MLVWQGSLDKMNVEEFKKLSMDNKIDWVYRTIGADVNTKSDSVAGLATRMVELDAWLAKLNCDLPADYMPGTQRNFDSFMKRNQAMILWLVSIS